MPYFFRDFALSGALQDRPLHRWRWSRALLPIGGWNNRHGTDGKIFVDFVKGWSRAGSSGWNNGCSHFHGFIHNTACAVEEAVKEWKHLSVAPGIIYRTSDYNTVSPGKLGSGFIYNVIENAMPVLTTDSARSVQPPSIWGLPLTIRTFIR